MKNKFAIAIPTYNRSEILKENILEIIEELKEFKIPLYISDDSNNSLTEFVVKELKKKYEGIHYIKNKKSLGHDKNCISTLMLPKEDYIWYLGDSLKVKKGMLKKILELIKEKEYTSIILNTEPDRVINLSKKNYNSGKKFFLELGWHVTMTGATIYNRDEMMKVFEKKKHIKYLGTNFPQMGILLEMALKKNMEICWSNFKVITTNKKKNGSYWEKDPFKVFGEDWKNFIFMLPNKYSDSDKRKVIKDHSRKSGLFNLKYYLLIRKDRILTFKYYIKYYSTLKYVSVIDVKIIPFVLLIPPISLKIIYKIIKKLKRRI
ncbi:MULTISPECIES: glycosyltransferase [Psychrilyobacter]|uniref:Glycosyltransferase n=1 Tax=Psychrilyobacter piezotolerans TaxID=2293438 RepID=A0ABX9KL41_9FUSO|nr:MULTISPECIES: glycosyltransferase family 2 protein [Psychrilyobacter]MCS5420410.1 glycosyltransferase family 2 protein [Psychrilyobacter sp. S5]NDI76420.1 glycosyltransferase family 2 protein [Psychrilyobacter piezotolerans]RDE66016.1 glycosyltransferase [Psychrilyobacter sp. S5]REI43194.1 glycosyltransferase [Psychrilyobacter piezotolerans]